MFITAARPKPLVSAPLALGAFMPQVARAADDPSFNYSGFATLGLVTTNTDDAKYIVGGEQGGATKSISADVDSKVGPQLTGKLNSIFSGTVQALAKQDGNGRFRPGFEWAFAKAQLSPEFSVRAGRMGAPFFAVSDFRDVGYANTWLRPPIDVYSQVPVSHFDGADAIYQANIGSVVLTTQAFAGESSANVSGTGAKFRRLYGPNLTAELDNGPTLRAGRAQAHVTFDSPSLNHLVTVLRSTPFAAVGEQISPDIKSASFTGIGLTYDQNNVVVASEYNAPSHQVLPALDDRLVPDRRLPLRQGPAYLTFSQVKVDSSNVDNTIPVDVNAALTTLKYTVDGALESLAETQKTVALGVRRDAWRSSALKAQFDRIKPRGGGLFYSTQPGFGQGQTVNVYSAAVDVVF